MRVHALHVLLQVMQGESLSTALPATLKKISAGRDQAFVQMLVYGVLRWYWQLDATLDTLMQKPLKAKDHDVRLIMLMAMFQLMDTRVPDYAAVNAAVELVRRKKKNWASGMVNAVLRNFLRQQQSIKSSLAENEQAQYAHPQWFITRLKQDWPQQWSSILEANNQHPPMVLRINRQKIAVHDYLQQLHQPAETIGHDAIRLQQAVDVSELPGYSEGWFSVQDAGAQQAAYLMELAPGQRVLDCCAAPGGKTAHMLELQPAIHMTAVDVSDQRLSRVRENLQRLNLQADIICGDAANPTDWWDGKPYDRILLDVPCSASGVIRRHPDIKLLRQADDIERLAETQQAILQAIWPLLAPGGRLLYVTCSVFRAENEQQMARFLATTTDAREIAIAADWGEARSHGRQIFPGQDGMDGFYYAALGKNT
ncbi:MAG: 16S rRNA (cytosine(967)-C(5))-methyltransferase RsmB [Gammaproteobacteria bacterium]|nr:MAG: 16S rRNA (cytosine(967)-C(5))-methyltransferase RsmB [Gammaproteobacteria bacterium]